MSNHYKVRGARSHHRAAVWNSVRGRESEHAEVGTEFGRLRKLRKLRRIAATRALAGGGGGGPFWPLALAARASAPLHGCPLFMIRFRVVILVRETRTGWDVLIPSPSKERSARRSNGSRFIFVELAPVPKVLPGLEREDPCRGSYVYICTVLDSTNVAVCHSSAASYCSRNYVDLSTSKNKLSDVVYD